MDAVDAKGWNMQMEEGGGGVQLEDEEAQAAGSLVNGPGPGA